MGITKKIKIAVENRTTYKVGLLQTKAYRVLNRRTAKLLAPFGISPIEWAFIGVLSEMPDGARSSLLAEKIGVAAPFVTKLVKKLSKKNFVEEKIDQADERAKRIMLTKKGKQFVGTTEPYLRNAFVW